MPTWSVANGVMELTERSEDDADYANSVDLTRQIINNGFGEEQIPGLDQISTSYLPRKKFYVEVHDPKMKAGDTITLTTRKYDGSQETKSYSLSQVDGLRFRTQQPLLFFDGPAFDAGTYQVESTMRTESTTSAKTAPLASQAPAIPGSATVEAQTAQAEVTDSKGRTFKAESDSVTYAALGDSLSMGCLGGNTQASGQRHSGPAQFAKILGLPMVLPEISGKGIPAALQPYSRDQRLVIHNPLNFFKSHKGHRANPDVVPNNLAITGADIRSIAEDTQMCDDSGVLSKLIFWAGKGEDTRKAVVVTDGQEKAPPDWLSSMDPLPSIVTIEAGANDALGVVIGGKGGEIFEKDATLCKEAPDPHHARNLSTVDSFKDEYRVLITSILDQYNGKDVKPTLIFLTVPDVSVIPAVVKLHYGDKVHPFSDAQPRSDFKATRKILRTLVLDDYFKNATMDSTALSGCKDGDCGMVGLIPFLKRACIPTRADNALGTPRKPHTLKDDEVLSPSEVDHLRANIRGFNRSILELLYKEDWDEKTPDGKLMKGLREEGRIRVFDMNYLLFLLQQGSDVPPSKKPPGSYTIVDVAKEIGNIDADALGIIAADRDAAWDFYKNYGWPNKLTATARGGVLGPDYVHPTPSGHQLIAMGELYLLKSAAESTDTRTIGGFRQKTLEEKFQEAADGLHAKIKSDPWVPDTVKALVP